jgi:AAA family ATP:ADP antiporter
MLGWTLNAAQAELIAKMLNMAVAFAAVVVFTAASRRLRREQLTYVFTAAFAVSFVFYALVLGSAGAITGWTYYWFGDLFRTVLVATFFKFLNDSVEPSAAKRLYGLVGLGGVAGGAFGSMFVASLIDRVRIDAWMWVCCAIGIVIVIVAFAAGRLVSTTAPKETRASPATAGNAAIVGAQLVFRSRYLISIVAIVGLYEIISTIMDFQFTATVAHYLKGDAIGRQFTTVYAFTNAAALVVQLFFASFVMTRFGVGVALLVLPLAALSGSMAFLVAPTLLIGSMLNTADNAFSYSINQSAKEALYVPTTRDEKYKAKAFIDMFVQRFAKALAVGVSLLLTTRFKDFGAVRLLSLFTAVMIAIWVWAAVYAGRHFREATDSPKRPTRT